MRIANLKKVSIDLFKGIVLHGNKGSINPANIRYMKNLKPIDGKLVQINSFSYFSTSLDSVGNDSPRWGYYFDPEKYDAKTLFYMWSKYGGYIASLDESSTPALNRLPLINTIKDAQKYFLNLDSSDSYFNYLKADANKLRIRDKLYIFSLSDYYEVRYIGKYLTTLNVPPGFCVIPSSLNDKGRINGKVSGTSGGNLNKYLGGGTWTVYYKAVIIYDGYQKGSGINLGSITCDSITDAKIEVELGVSKLPPNVSGIYIYRGYIPSTSSVTSQDQVEHRMIYEMPLQQPTVSSTYLFRADFIRVKRYVNFGFTGAEFTSNGILASEQTNIMDNNADIIGLEQDTSANGTRYYPIYGDVSRIVYRRLSYSSGYASDLYYKYDLDRIGKRVRTFSTFTEDNAFGFFKEYINSSSGGVYSYSYKRVHSVTIILKRNEYKIEIDGTASSNADAIEYAKAFDNATEAHVRLWRIIQQSGDVKDAEKSSDFAFEISSVSSNVVDSDYYIYIYLNKTTAIDFQSIIDIMSDESWTGDTLSLNPLSSGNIRNYHAFEISSIISYPASGSEYVVIDSQANLDLSNATYAHGLITVDSSDTGGSYYSSLNIGDPLDVDLKDIDDIDPSKSVLYDNAIDFSHATWGNFTTNTGENVVADWKFNTISTGNLGTIQNGLKLTFTDDGYEDIIGEVFTDIYINMNFKYAVISEDRMVVAYLKKDDGLYPDAISISEPGEYQRFTNVYNASWGDSDEITGLASIGEIIYVFKRRKILVYRLYKSNGELQYINSFDGFGTSNYKSIISIGSSVFFADDISIYEISGSKINDIGYLVRSTGTNEKETLRSIELNELKPEYDYFVYNEKEKLLSINSWYYYTNTYSRVAYFDFINKLWNFYIHSAPQNGSEFFLESGQPYKNNNGIPVFVYKSKGAGFFNLVLISDNTEFSSTNSYNKFYLETQEMAYSGNTMMEWRRIYIDAKNLSGVSVEIHTDRSRVTKTLPSSGWLHIRLRGNYIKIIIDTGPSLEFNNVEIYKIEAYGRPIRTK